MKIAELHESEDLPGVDCNDANAEKFFPDFADYSNVVEHGEFFDTFDEALKVAGDNATEHFITFDYSKYAAGESAETDLPEAIYSVLIIQPAGDNMFNVLQFKPEKFTKNVSKSQLDALIRRFSKKLEHEEIELEFRVLGW